MRRRSHSVKSKLTVDVFFFNAVQKLYFLNFFRCVRFCMSRTMIGQYLTSDAVFFSLFLHTLYERVVVTDGGFVCLFVSHVLLTDSNQCKVPLWFFFCVNKYSLSCDTLPV